MGRNSVGEGTFSRNNLRVLREKRDMTQTELSKISGISTSQISRIELGKRPTKLDVLDTLAKALGVTRGQLANVGSPTETITVASYVQAGIWSECFEWPQDDRYEVTIMETNLYGSATRHASEVRGPSMNKVYPERTVVIWVDFKEINEPLIPGRRYVLNRYDRGSKVEHTVKTFSRDREGREWFYPESDDPNFQEPIAYADTKEHKITVAGRVINSIRAE